MNVKIIKMEECHIQPVAAIEAEVFSVPWSAGAFKDALAMEHALFDVAIAGGEVAGYCGIYVAADEGEITNVAVAPSYRRHNIAGMLLHSALSQAYTKGVRRAFLEVRRSNAPAIQLYQKTGFQVVGARKDYYQDPCEDALVMMCGFADI